jgi:S-adenosylmethionine hydrolase
MAIITFISDFGYSDHYVAAVKGKILQVDPGLQIVDISHSIQHFDLAHCSHVLKMVFKDFPTGTVHLIAVNSNPREDEALVALELENHYFVGADNGIFGLISDKEPTKAVAIAHPDSTSESFPARDVLANVAARLAKGDSLDKLGEPLPSVKRLLGRSMRATKKQISGHVVRVDHYGNLITNIEKQAFDILSKERNFKVVFGRENVSKIHKTIHNTGSGDVFVVFNSLGYLEVGINHGNASELLGLQYDSPINIIFEE